MSSIRWSGNRLVQKIKKREEELGLIDLEPSSNKYVLWLNDTFGVAGTTGAYIRADEYPSLEVAKSKALNSPIVFIWHCIWMRCVLKREVEMEFNCQWKNLSFRNPDLSKQCLLGRLLTYIDGIHFGKVKELFEKIGGIAFSKAVSELIDWIIDKL